MFKISFVAGNPVKLLFRFSHVNVLFVIVLRIVKRL